MMVDTLIPVRCDQCAHRGHHSLSGLAQHRSRSCPRGCGATLRIDLSRAELWARIAEAIAQDSVIFEL